MPERRRLMKPIAAAKTPAIMTAKITAGITLIVRSLNDQTAA